MELEDRSGNQPMRVRMKRDAVSPTVTRMTMRVRYQVEYSCRKLQISTPRSWMEEKILTIIINLPGVDVVLHAKF